MSGLATGCTVSCSGAGRVVASAASGGAHLPSASMATTRNLMAPGSGLTMPRLSGIPQNHRSWRGEQAAARLASTLLRAGIASPSDWSGESRNPFEFLKKALDRWIAEHGGAEFREEFRLNLTLSTLAMYSSDDREGDAADLYLIVEPDSAGYVVLGPTLRCLAKIHPRLPVTFVHTFIGAVNRWIRVYDWRDALARLERLREWYETDAEADLVELPDVERDIPACMRLRPLGAKTLRRLCPTIKDRWARRLIDAVLDLDAAAARARRPIIDGDCAEKFVDCGEPLPALLAVFEEHDAIEGQFDEESQGMLEMTPEPNVALRVNSADEQAVRQTFDALAACCEALAHAARLLKIMAGQDGRIVGV